jgi:hypothetical protein
MRQPTVHAARVEPPGHGYPNPAHYGNTNGTQILPIASAFPSNSEIPRHRVIRKCSRDLFDVFNIPFAEKPNNTDEIAVQLSKVSLRSHTKRSVSTETTAETQVVSRRHEKTSEVSRKTFRTPAKDTMKHALTTNSVPVPRTPFLTKAGNEPAFSVNDDQAESQLDPAQMEKFMDSMNEFMTRDEQQRRGKDDALELSAAKSMQFRL